MQILGQPNTFPLPAAARPPPPLDAQLEALLAFKTSGGADSAGLLLSWAGRDPCGGGWDGVSLAMGGGVIQTPLSVFCMVTQK